MLDTVSKTVYKAFGYHIQSDIPLPELQLSGNDGTGVDIVIRTTDLTDEWSRLVSPQKLVVTENRVMFEVADTAIFSIHGGKTIDVTPKEGASGDRIRLFILGSCMGSLLLQRRILPLHGSAVAIDGKAYAIIGSSGNGKSTLASALLQRGFQLLSDDVIAVTLGDDHVPYVIPAYPQQKLWQESMHAFGMETSEYRPLYDRETKYAIPVRSQFAQEALPLAGIFELVKTESGQARLRGIERLERLQLLYRHTYRNFLLADSGLMQWHLHTTASFAGKVDIYQLSRPLQQFTAHQLSSILLTAIGKENTTND
ncbi:HPr kinase/phosphorylase [Paenibacillus spongiae]|uniref:Aldolase n=1 Tax=Paenibacillus spongiae TaxID=2909671 RepID=A0ABY5SCX1_9BACL|nr:aldolase [Paenibacillus spongiae]UVI31514.1 aldolase [Paenibacillus spongiae]